jgi:hypothetical protein
MAKGQANYRLFGGVRLLLECAAVQESHLFKAAFVEKRLFKVVLRLADEARLCHIHPS